LAGALVVAALSVVFGFAGITWQWRRAETERRLNQRMAYNSDMNLAFRALADRTRGRARELMERYRPRTISETDLRGWEWRYLWQQSAGQSAMTLCERNKSIERLAFTPDGQKLWVGELLGGISLWNLTRKQPILEYPELTCRGGSAFDSPRHRVAQSFSRNGRDFILWVRETARAEPVFRYETNDIVTAPAFSPDGRRLAARIGSDRVCVWDLETQQAITNLPTRTFYGRLDVPPVEFLPRGDLLAVGGFDGTIRLWELTSGRVRSVEQDAPDVWALGFSPEGKYLASAGPPLNVFHVWDVATLARRDLRGSARTYRGFAFDPTRPVLAAGAWEEHAIEFWNLETGQLMMQLKGQPEMLYCLAFSPDGTILASGGRASGTDKAYVRLWNRQAIQPQPAAGYRALTNLYSAPVFSPDSRTFLAACGPLVRFDIAALQTNEVLTVYGTNNGAVAISPDGALLVTGDWRGKIHVWDARTHRHLTNLVAGRSAVWRLRFLAHGRLLVARSGEGFGGIWETATWREKRLGHIGVPGSASVSSADASPDGRWLATGHIDGLIRLWNLASGERIKEFAGHTEWVNAVAFSPDGQWLASLSQDDSIILRDLTGSVAPTTLRGHNNPPFDLAFSPDGRRLVVSLGNPDQAVILWDVATSQLLASLRGEGTVYTEPTFSPDGNTLVVVNQESLALFWHAPSFAEIEVAEKERASMEGPAGPRESIKR
jgi:WD40 repeat protein